MRVQIDRKPAYPGEHVIRGRMSENYDSSRNDSLRIDGRLFGHLLRHFAERVTIKKLFSPLELRQHILQHAVF